MSDLFGPIGQIAAAGIQASAIKDATKMQIDALQKQRDFVFANLDPNAVQAQATAADIQNAYSRLALQGQIDPALLQARYQSEANLLNQGAQIGALSGPVSQAAAGEALGPGGTAAQGKQQLIDAALQHLQEGATLPPDVQAELVQSGLERSGMVTGQASAQGIGGTLLRQIVGTAGLQLQAQRQAQAANLLGSAQNLEASRAQILNNLFPSLASTQLQNLQGTEGVLGTSAGMLPNAGLGGTNIANIMLARVGATNQLTQSAADAMGKSGMALGQVWGNAVGNATGMVGQSGIIPSTGSVFKNIFGGSGGGGGGGGYDAFSGLG
jgi:hypothetical protein